MPGSLQARQHVALPPGTPKMDWAFPHLQRLFITSIMPSDWRKKNPLHSGDTHHLEPKWWSVRPKDCEIHFMELRILASTEQRRTMPRHQVPRWAADAPANKHGRGPVDVPWIFVLYSSESISREDVRKNRARSIREWTWLESRAGEWTTSACNLQNLATVRVNSDSSHFCVQWFWWENSYCTQ